MNTGDRNAVTDGTQQERMNKVSNNVRDAIEKLPVGTDSVNLQSNEISSTATMEQVNIPIVKETGAGELSAIDSNMRNYVTASESADISETTTSFIEMLNGVTVNED